MALKDRSVACRSPAAIWFSSSRFSPFQSCSLMAGQVGDGLEDDYIPDELVASSGDEEDSQHGSSHGDLSLDDDAPKPSGSAAHAESEKSNKRKRSGKDKQRKPKVSISFKPLDYSKLNTREQKPKLKETQVGQSSLIALQSPSELAEYLAGSQAKSFSRLSRIELEDIRIPGECGPQRNHHGLTCRKRARLLIHPHGLPKGPLTRYPISSPKVGSSQSKTETWD
jgi:hypothetical protein